MNCHQFAAVLDEHALDTAGRDASAALEAHARACNDCADALAAFRALAADPVPASVSSAGLRTLLAHAGSARRGSGPRRVRRRRRKAAAAVSLFGLAGAAFATLHWLGTRATSSPGSPSAPAAADGAAEHTPGASTRAAPSLVDYVDAAEAEAHRKLDAQIMSAPDLPDGDMFPLLKMAPKYPLEAARRGLEGYAILEFTVTEQGDVSDVKAVASSDPLFTASSIETVRGFKYKPRVVDGRAVAVHGVRNRFVYALEKPAPGPRASPDAPAPKEQEQAGSGDTPSMNEFVHLLAPAYRCLETGDLTCIELNLDELRATYSLNASQLSMVWRIYGYVDHRQGNYERAIAAYRRAAELMPPGTYEHSLTLMTVARIYYERREYQQALDAAVAALKGAKHASPADYVFVDRLRQLGAVVHTEAAFTTAE